MDSIVARSLQKWPGIPDVYGWLRLDRRGAWRIRSGNPEVAFELIGHPALNEFIARNYAVDERGCWYFQNGPQRVFVGLDYAPFVFRFEGGTLIDHCGSPVADVEAAWLDEEGSLILKGGGRAGLMADRDLLVIADDLAAGILRLGKQSVRVGTLPSSGAEAHLGFVREPVRPG